ncbi:MAG: DNA mismatch repair endonuclease MutL [Clostridia bacterium]|nr:DNA mismatch repair endonuclease MutL [Clostridia bacterium]
MPKINVMPKHLADLIAAGEVVERPASIVKELLENSVDAGADTVTLEIRNGGISYIRVTDNGCGIAREDVRNAFVSHATSKITTAEHLNSIMTLGFRGEALASVAAVARVEMLTRTPGEETGTGYFIEFGEEISLDDAGCPLGTTITVKDLFLKTPARMKFLKKDVTEANLIAGVMDRIALSHPEVSFRFIREGKQTLMTSGSGDLLTAIREVLGKEIASQMIDCKGESGAVRVEGFISKPAFSRPNRNLQFFFVNDRFVKTGTGSAALSESYKSRIMVGKFPSCVLKISVSPDAVDVNVHPAKTEVRFSDEKSVFNAVYSACKNALDEKDSPSQITKIGSAPNFTASDYRKWQEPAQQIKMPQKNEDFWQTQSVRPQREPEKPEVSTTVTAKAPESEIPEDDERIDSIDDILLSSPAKREANERPQDTPVHTSDEKPLPADSEVFESEQFRLIGEAFMTYIICEYKGKLVFIDKHAAHERIIYERLKKESGERSAQVLLSPVTVSLSKEEYSAAIENLSLINSSGFLAEDFGTGTLLVRECPMELTAEDVPFVIAEIAGRFLDRKQDVDFEKLDWIFHSVACRSAIKSGDFTSRLEMETFAKQLLSMPDIRYCPHGRPVLIEMTERELEKNFGRV